MAHDIGVTFLKPPFTSPFTASLQNIPHPGHPRSCSGGEQDVGSTVITPHPTLCRNRGEPRGQPGRGEARTKTRAADVLTARAQDPLFGEKGARKNMFVQREAEELPPGREASGGRGKEGGPYCAVYFPTLLRPIHARTSSPMTCGIKRHNK